MRRLKMLSFGIVLTLIAFIFTLPGPDTFTEVRGVTPEGAKYHAVFKHPGQPIIDIRSHAQGAGIVQNPRNASALLVYEEQEFGAATTATSASAGATASDAMTWAIPWADNNYSGVCQLSGTATAVPAIISNVHTSTTITKVHAAITAAAASNAAPGFDCIAIHY